MIGAETILPLYIQDMRGYNALKSGLLLLPGAFLLGVMSPITGRIFDNVGARGLALVGFALLGGATVPFTYLIESTSITFMTVMYAARMFGISMLLMPITTAGLNQLQRNLLPHGTAMINTMRQVAGSIGTAVLISIMRSTSANSYGMAPPEAMINGVNTAFIVANVLAFIGLFLSLFIKNNRPQRKW